jgi:hypothetical protein
VVSRDAKDTGNGGGGGGGGGGGDGMDKGRADVRADMDFERVCRRGLVVTFAFAMEVVVVAVVVELVVRRSGEDAVEVGADVDREGEGNEGVVGMFVVLVRFVGGGILDILLLVCGTLNARGKDA